MRIILLGSGNVATHLSKALRDAGHQIVQVWSRTLSNARDLAVAVDAQFTENLSQISPVADLYILAVSDDAIEEIATSFPHKDKVLVHTSGTTDMEIEGICGVLYPLQTFSKRKEVNFSVIPIAIESRDIRINQILNSVAQSISSKVIQLNSRQRRSLHVAAVFACNFTNHFYAIAGQILDRENLEFDLIRPLIKETADKVGQSLPAAVQTGPAVRGDQSTVNKHLQYLENNKDLQELYSRLSQSIINFHQKT